MNPQGLDVCFGQPDLHVCTGQPITRSIMYYADYNLLDNKPQINSVELSGDVSAEDLGLGRLYYNTTEYWNQQTSLVSESGALYIYSDYQTIEDEHGNIRQIAGIKIGDGTSYVVDMPFITESTSSMLLEHINNKTVHITDAERECWNNKVTAFLNPHDGEELILSKDCHIPGPHYDGMTVVETLDSHGGIIVTITGRVLDD